MSTTTHADPPTDTGTTDDQRREDAREYGEQLRVFSVHACVFAGSMVIMLVVNLATNAAAGIIGDWWAWWSAYALLGWGLGVSIHGLVVRMSRPRGSGPTWEERQIDKILSSEESAPSQ
ncbi:MAG: 2TM domain-containing protein [Acidimicrobiia bacterium]